MKLAVNYSPQAAQLVRDGAIDTDLFKCPPWPDLVRSAGAHRPVYIHFDLDAGAGTLADADWSHVESLLAETDTPYVNLHLAGLTRDYPGIPVDTAAPADIERVTERLLRDVEAVARRFGPERVIVENVPYRGTLGTRKDPGKVTLRPVADPAVATRIAEETGCGLLLDTAHARIAAHYLGVDVREYLARIPVRHLRELHVVGVTDDGTRLREHMPMTSEDWALVEWIAARIRNGDWARPWVLGFEYGGVGPGYDERSKVEVLAEQVPRLADVVRRVNAAAPD